MNIKKANMIIKNYYCVYENNKASCTKNSNEVAATILIKSETTTTNSIEVEFKTTNTSNYECKINYDDAIIKKEENKCIYKNLKNDTEYKYEIKLTNYYDEKFSTERKIKTKDYNEILINEDDTNWTQKKEITISGQTAGSQLQYKVIVSSDTSKNIDWLNIESGEKIILSNLATPSQPTTVYARFYDGINYSNEETLTITKIDTVTPTVRVTAKKSSAGTVVSSNSWSNQTLNYTLTAGTTGASGYKIYFCGDRNNTCTPSTLAKNNTVITNYQSTVNTYYFRYKIVSGANKSSSVGTYIAKVDTTPPAKPTLYRGYQAINSFSFTIEPFNYNPFATGSTKAKTSSVDPQIKLTPIVTFNNVIGFVQNLEIDRDDIIQVFYAPIGGGYSEANSKFVKLKKGFNRAFIPIPTGTYSSYRVDIGRYSGQYQNIHSGFLIAANNQYEKAGNYEYGFLFTRADSSGSGFNSCQCKVGSGSWNNAPLLDNYCWYDYGPGQGGAANGTVVYCRILDKAGNASSAVSSTIRFN